MDINRLLPRQRYDRFHTLLKNLGDTTSEASKILPHESVRPLDAGEIKVLEQQGNLCSDWSLIQVSIHFSPSNIFNNQFIGSVIIGNFNSGKETTSGSGLPAPRGIFRSVISESRIGDNCSVMDCSMIHSSILFPGTVLHSSNITADTSDGPLHYGNGTRLPIGIETGGRELTIFTDLSMETAEHILRNIANAELQQGYEQLVRNYMAEIAGTMCIIDEGAEIRNCPTIHNSYIGPGSRINAAQAIQNSTLLSIEGSVVQVSHGSIVRDAILQDAVHVDDGAIIDRSMMFEHSHCEHHGSVIDSVVGPNSGVSKGEITSSFLGPFVGFHHQSLLIATFWPGGRGNIGYGANIGSNHTSRMPDQECWPAEGMFFGLGCAVKYPANFSKAAYSIIAAGVTTLPQEMDFPFSLINEPPRYYEDLDPGINNLVPGWGLFNNLYSLKRNEAKYRKRNAARRAHYDFTVFRPEIVESMKSALRNLESIHNIKDHYLPGMIPGMGKNMLQERNRLKAIEAYRFFIRYTELIELAKSAFTTNTPADMTTKAHLEEYSIALDRILEGTIDSRKRDIIRGSRIFPDYQDTHPSIEEDPFIIEVRQEVQEEKEKITTVLSR